MSPNLRRIMTEVEKPDGSEGHIPNPHQSAESGHTRHSVTTKALETTKDGHIPHAEEEASIPYDVVQAGDINSF